MFHVMTRGPVDHRRPSHRRDLHHRRRLFGVCDRLEERTLLAAPTLSLISENLANNGADVGDSFPASA